MADVPTGQPIFQSSIPEAQIYADLISTRDDIHYTKMFLLESLKGHHDDIKTALFNAAHISYRRAFNRGRKGLGSLDIDAIGNNAIELHRYIYAQADKLVAHSVNRFEEVKIGVVVINNQVSTDAVISVRSVGTTEENIKQWLKLLSEIERVSLTPKIEGAREKFLAAARKIPVSQIMRAEEMKYVHPGPEYAGRKR